MSFLTQLIRQNNMDKEQQLKEKAEQLALLPSSENPVQKLKELLKDETDIAMTSRVVSFFYLAVEEKFYGKEKNKSVNQATRLINTYPLPDDAEEQLNALTEQATSDYERFQLGCLAEALFVIRHS